MDTTTEPRDCGVCYSPMCACSCATCEAAAGRLVVAIGRALDRRAAA